MNLLVMWRRQLPLQFFTRVYGQLNCSARVNRTTLVLSRKTSLFILSALRCFNMFIAFNFFIPALLGIVFFFLLQGFWDRKSGIKYSASRAFFPACFLPCTSRSRGRHWRCLACLLSHVFRACFKFDSKQVISKTLFGRRQNKKQAAGEKSYDDIKFFFQVKAN